MIRQVFAAALLLAVTAGLPSPAHAGHVRTFVYRPGAGDSPQRMKCKTEAFQMISGVKGAAQYAEYNRQLRKHHFRTCMAGEA
jgi:hypothetical protein